MLITPVETQAMPTLLSRYVRSGKLKVEARPVAIRGADSVRGRSAAIAAGLQNKMFNFMQLLYDNQGKSSENSSNERGGEGKKATRKKRCMQAHDPEKAEKQKQIRVLS